MKCNRLVQYENLGGIDWCACQMPAKYKVEYNSSTNGKKVTEFVCGIHFNSVKKASQRLLKKFKYDSKLTFEKID